MTFEEDFSHALRGAADLAPDRPGDVLARAAVRIGYRRRQRRRSLLAAGAGVLALAGVTVVGVATHGPYSPAGRPRSDRITGDFMLRTMTSLLPTGQVVEGRGFGIGEVSPPEAGPVASVIFDDGRGAAMISLNTDRVALPITGRTGGTQCTDSFDEPVESCTRTVRPDGSVLLIEKFGQRNEYMAKTWTAIYTGTDGRHVRVDETNSRTTGVPFSRENPPLNEEQLAALVTSGLWDPLFEEFIGPPTPRPTAPVTRTPAPLPPAAEVLERAERQLPAGAEAADGGAQESAGTAHFPVTLDGRTSTLTVSVTPHWRADDLADPRAFFLDSGGSDPVTRTPDGTAVIVRVTGASKGSSDPALHWNVEALHPDGTLVTVGEFNGDRIWNAGPGSPALSTDQLIALATGPVWRG
ncbi:hypothetical protein AB0K43_00060 [Kitasatospora sp. NPDC049258]|uniref:hypothetical protein n=1 Tax=Kitasatospora sp. NPDC049258 TaxID=3155394 RepID=UPI0034309088